MVSNNRLVIQLKIKEFTDRSPQNPSDIIFGKKVKLCSGCGIYSEREHLKYQVLLNADIEELEEVLKYRKGYE
jgi:hypothetical protein